ncbi:MAG: Na/Pi cotransporter family protein, partial [Muribaculaceae bacterium]|nr:Na/Pi cotransporter family protein [Muribaculaceae bacterium]
YINHLRVETPEVYNHLFDTSSNPDTQLQLSIEAATPMLRSLQFKASIGLCVFYTTYKLINLSIMIWFTKLYVKVVDLLIPSKKKGDDEFQLKFIGGTLMQASELNITQAEKEMFVYAERVGRMIGMARELVHTKSGGDEFNKRYSRLEKYEEISDRMELEIANYLNRTAEGRLSNASKRRIVAMMGIDSEVESIADCCLGIGKILLRKQQSNVHFNDEIYLNIDRMFDYVQTAMDSMLRLLEAPDSVTENELIVCYNNEREINNFRNTLRQSNVTNINDHHYEYQSGIHYMDIISTLEKTGDYIINVVDTIKTEFKHVSIHNKG